MGTRPSAQPAKPARTEPDVDADDVEAGEQPLVRTHVVLTEEGSRQFIAEAVTGTVKREPTPGLLKTIALMKKLPKTPSAR